MFIPLELIIIGFDPPPTFKKHHQGSENRVYSQKNSHLIGIMISKTIGFRGTLFSDTPTSSFSQPFVPFGEGAGLEVQTYRGPGGHAIGGTVRRKGAAVVDGVVLSNDHR